MNNLICPCVFIKKITSRFIIIVIYVDDLNIIETHKEVLKVMMYLKNESKMKHLGEIKYCIGLQIEHFQSGILLHQSNYTEKVLKRFNMDKVNPLSTPMVVRSLNVEKIHFALGKIMKRFLVLKYHT